MTNPSEFQEIMSRMEEIKRTRGPKKPTIRTGGATAGSSRVRPLEPAVNVPASCEKFSKKGFGAASMTVQDLIKVISEGPSSVRDKLKRMKTKTRPELCKLLNEFARGRELLYPKNAPKVEAEMPNLNNIEKMMNMAENEFRRNSMMRARTVASKYDPSRFTFTNLNNTPSSPNFVNYANGNNVNNTENRMREEMMYQRKLAEKRVVSDPLAGKLSAANMKRFKVQPLVRKPKAQPKPSSTSRTPVKYMNFSGDNARVPTKTTGGLVVTTSPRLNKATMRKLRNNAVGVRKELKSILNKFEKVPPVQRTAMIRARIYFLRKILDDPKFENKFIEKQKYRLTILERLGLESPPPAPPAPKKAFSTSGNANLTPGQSKLLTKIMSGRAKKNDPKINVDAIRNVVKKYLATKNIATFKIQGKDCMSYKKKTLVKLARELTKGKMTNLDSLTKEELCKIIKQNISKK